MSESGGSQDKSGVYNKQQWLKLTGVNPLVRLQMWTFRVDLSATCDKKMYNYLKVKGIGIYSSLMQQKLRNKAPTHKHSFAWQ